MKQSIFDITEAGKFLAKVPATKGKKKSFVAENVSVPDARQVAISKAKEAQAPVLKAEVQRAITTGKVVAPSTVSKVIQQPGMGVRWVENNPPEPITIGTEYGKYQYTPSPDEWYQWKNGTQQDQLAIRQMITERARIEAKDAGMQPVVAKPEEFASALDVSNVYVPPVEENSQFTKTLNLAYQGLLMNPAARKASQTIGDVGTAMQEKGAELTASAERGGPGYIAGAALGFGGGIVEGAANPPATFMKGVGNIYDPKATLEERGGAGLNLILTALGLMPAAEAALLGIRGYKAGLTGTEALTLAGRDLLQSSVPFGTKIDTALVTKAANKASLKNLIDVLETEGQMMGKTRAALTKDFVDAGKTYAKETGKTAEEFYTKYLNDFAEGKGQMTTPPSPATFELPGTTASTAQAPTVQTPTVNIPEPTTPSVFDWNPTTEAEVRKTWFDWFRSKSTRSTDEQILDYVNKQIDELKLDSTKNPYARKTSNGVFDIRTNAKLPSEYLEPTVVPTSTVAPAPPTSVIPEPTVAPTPVTPPTSVIPEPTTPSVFDWNPTTEAEVRKTWFDWFRSKSTRSTDEQILDYVNKQIDELKLDSTKNPYARKTSNGVFDIRTNAKLPSEYLEPTPVTPPTSTPTGNIPDPNAIPPVEPTSIKNEAMARDLKEMGFDDLPETQKQTFNEFLNEAEQRGLTQQTALDNILKDFEDGKVRQLDKAETLAMAKHAAELKNKIRDLRVRFRENPTGALADEIATAQERFNIVAGAVKRAGAEQAKALVARKAFLDKDYDITSVLSEAAENRMAGKTSAQIRAEAEKIAKRTGESVDEVLKNGLHSKKEIEILTKRAEEAEKAAAEANAAKEALKKDLEDGLLAQQRAAKRTARTVENAKARAEVAKKDFLALAGKMTANLDPTLLKPLAQFIKAKIDEGVIILKGEGAIDQVVDILKKEGLDVDAVDVADALQFDRMNNRRPLSDLQKEKQRLLAELRAEAKKISPNAAEDAAKMDARKQALKDQIRDLDEQIKSGNYLEKVPKEIQKRDRELEALRAIRDLKRRQVDFELQKLKPKTVTSQINQFFLSNQLANLASRITDMAQGVTFGLSKLPEIPAYQLANTLTSKVLGTNKLSMSFLKRPDDILRRAAVRAGVEWKGTFGQLGGRTVGEKLRNFTQGLGGTLAEAGDVPFKSIYETIGADMAAEDKAIDMLKASGKSFTQDEVDMMREAILRDLDNHPDVALAAKDFALTNTFNNSNKVSAVSNAIKRTLVGQAKGTEIGDFVDSAIDVLGTRFGKVIANAGLAAGDYIPGVGLVRGAGHLVYYKKLIKEGKMIPFAKRDQINQMIARGLTGLATYELFKEVGAKWLGNGIQGEKGNYYIDYGDAGKMGGLTIPMMVATAQKQLDEFRDPNTGDPIPDDEKKKMMLKFSVDLALSNPLASNLKDITVFLDGNPDALYRYIAKKSSNVLVPAQFRDIAKRQEAKGPFGILTGEEPQRSKFKVWDPEEGKRGGVVTSKDWRVIFGDEFKSKLPRTMFNPNFNRQTLPIKGQEEEALRP